MAFVDDMVITGTIKTKLAEDELINATDVDVDTTNGVVTLGGTVDTEEAKEEAEYVTLGVEGVREVINEIEVNPGQAKKPRC